MRTHEREWVGSPIGFLSTLSEDHAAKMKASKHTGQFFDKQKVIPNTKSETEGRSCVLLLLQKVSRWRSILGA